MFNPGWHLALDMHSMLKISEAVAKCALVREESRGAHSRIDFPETERGVGNEEQHHQPGFQRRNESSSGSEIGFARRVEASARRGRRQMIVRATRRSRLNDGCARMPTVDASIFAIMDIPWKSLAPVEPGREYIALLSYLPLTRYSKIAAVLSLQRADQCDSFAQRRARSVTRCERSFSRADSGRFRCGTTTRR